MYRTCFIILGVFTFTWSVGIWFGPCLASGDISRPPKLIRTDFITGLSSPWDLAFLPDEAMLFTEKCRGLSVRWPDGKVRRLFGTKGSAVVASDLFCEGQSGMLGVAIDPEFAKNRAVFVYMASNLGKKPRANRVVRLTVDAGYTTVANRTDIVTDIPFKESRNAWGGPGTHSGGRIRFGPEGFLYITTGDNHDGALPQDLKRLGGKVLRVDRDGKPAPGINMLRNADPRIFTYGHRNVQGIDFHPETGQPFIAEHGPGHSDEVTPLRAGGNGGWDPKPEAGVKCADNYCGYVSNRADGRPTSMTDMEKFPDAMRPIFSYSDSEGLSPCTFVTHSRWGSWKDRLLIGFLAGQRIDVLKVSPGGVRASVTTADLPAVRYRGLVQGPNGYLYVITDADRIWQVVPN